MYRIHVSVLISALLSSAATADHDRVSLDHKVRMSDLIVIGTVTSIDGVKRSGLSFDPAETASKVAAIQIEKVLKGRLDEPVVRVGFLTTYSGEDDASIRSIAISPDGKRIVGGGGERLLKVWDSNTGKEQLVLEGHAETIYAVAFSLDGKLIASGGGGLFVPGEIKIWNAVTGDELHSFKAAHRVGAVAFSPDSKRLAWTDDSSMSLLVLATGKQSTLHQTSRWNVHRFAFSSDGRRIAVGGRMTITLFDAETGKKLRTLTGHGNSVYALSFSRDGRRIVSGGLDEMLKIWNVETGEENMSVNAHQTLVRSVAFSPNGRYVASTGGFDKTLKIWDAETGEKVRHIDAHDDYVFSIAYSPDGTRIISGSGDKTVKVWDAATGKNVLTIRGRDAFRVGQRHLLFLRKLRRPFLATTNWQYGVFRIVDGHMDDPWWPASQASWTCRFNQKADPFDSTVPSKNKGRIPIQDAITMISQAIQIAESEVDLGYVEIDDAFAHVFYEAGSDGFRVGIRMPRYVDCPTFQPERLGAKLLTREKSLAPLRDMESGSVPASVDPLGVTTQVSFTFPGNVAAEDVVGVTIVLDGEKGTYCLPDRRAADDCPADSVTMTTADKWWSADARGAFFLPRPCRACGSSQVLRIAYGLYMPDWDDPCGNRKRFGRVHSGGCVGGNETWHCNTCGTEW